MADLFHRLPCLAGSTPLSVACWWGPWLSPSPRSLGPAMAGCKRASATNCSSIPLWIVLSSVRSDRGHRLSIGSGGSGGSSDRGWSSGPSSGLRCGALCPSFPSLGHNPAPYVIVGMMSCFGGISRAPLAVMLMVAEMTGSISILVPAMVAVGISWLIVRRNDDTIYRSQLKSRTDAPSQRLLAGLPLLGAIPVSRAMAVAEIARHPGRTVCRRSPQFDGA